MAATRSALRHLWRPATTTAFASRTLFQSKNTIQSPLRTFQTTARRSAHGRGFNYQRWQSTSGLLRRWSQSPTFYYQVTAISVGVSGVYVYNLETVPVSGRRRFNVISAEFEKQQGDQMYQDLLQEYRERLLPPHHPKVQMVQRVLDRLIPHSGLNGEMNRWEVHVIDEDTKNAFVIPGGKVFVFSGILDVCQGEDGLAAVLGHEIAHNVAHHAAEKMSQTGVLMMGAYAVLVVLGAGDFFGLSRVLLDVGFMRPNGRKQESEADYIGLMMMSEACFDPRQAVELWRRMEKEEEHAPPQFLSTHPSNRNRIAAITNWLDEAERKHEQSGCGVVTGYADDFKNTFERWRST